MPFENCPPHYFSPVSVGRNAPSASGVFGLSNSREWIYVGEAENIRLALLDLIQSPDRAVTERGPTAFAFELSPPDRRIARQDRLIQELAPVCNRRASSVSRLNR